MENVKLFLSQKSQFDLLEKIKNKNKNARAHHFLNLQRTGNKKIFYVALGLIFILSPSMIWKH